ncbi:MAG: hypothetical protein ACI4MF_01460 [Candidatus Faecivicinus sp.]
MKMRLRFMVISPFISSFLFFSANVQRVQTGFNTFGTGIHPRGIYHDGTSSVLPSVEMENKKAAGRCPQLFSEGIAGQAGKAVSDNANEGMRHMAHIHIIMRQSETAIRFMAVLLAIKSLSTQ